MTGSLCALCATDVSVLVIDGNRGGQLVTYECCGKLVCRPCRDIRPRLERYCPFCQTSARDNINSVSSFQLYPPEYDLPLHNQDDDDNLPTYQDSQKRHFEMSKRGGILHYVGPNDSVHSLCLKYGVDMDTIRKTNHIYSDHLIAGRTTVWIPMTNSQLEQYHARSRHNDEPVTHYTIQHELKLLLKRFQINTKCIDYDMAKVYMDQNDWNLSKAISQYKYDEEWEMLHPDPIPNHHNRRSFASRIFNL